MDSGEGEDDITRDGEAYIEGAVEGVGCPGWECTKDRALPDAEGKEKDTERGNETGQDGEKKREVDVDFVRGVVGDELATRYVWLLEKKRVETDPTYTVCPLPHCQAPVPPPSTRKPNTTKKVAKVFRLSSNHGNHPPDQTSATTPCIAERDAEPDDRFRQCPACQFSFCRYCLKTWHGPSPCPLPSTASFLRKYMSLPADSPERAAFEKRYGKKQLTRMVAQWEEQEANNASARRTFVIGVGKSCAPRIRIIIIGRPGRRVSKSYSTRMRSRGSSARWRWASRGKI
ncbi:hypothetical protein QFC20_007004 [Naganishia adeliensis]|uniref:Uncharacterized protein n=1 Tax=Naganishia adeliensis TaxID=92952 RepID=A0ACC2V4A5_9TREE|nr:hypothetical protein QFC20_007004 [Naganishia adeliensis]